MEHDDNTDEYWTETYRTLRSQLEWDEVNFETEMRQQMEKSHAHKDFYGAALAARQSAKADGILPILDFDGTTKLTGYQGVKAACMAREDIETVTAVQLSVLQRLDRIHLFQVTSLEASTATLALLGKIYRLAWIIVGLLVYLAYRLS
jgi:hypothetical protein